MKGDTFKDILGISTVKKILPLGALTKNVKRNAPKGEMIALMTRLIEARNKPATYVSVALGLLAEQLKLI